jgi:hypothetical protein
VGVGLFGGIPDPETLVPEAVVTLETDGEYVDDDAYSCVLLATACACAKSLSFSSAAVGQGELPGDVLRAGGGAMSTFFTGGWLEG